MTEKRSKQKKHKNKNEMKDKKPSNSTAKNYVMRGSPLFLEYVLGIGSLLKYLGIFVGVMFVITIVLLGIYILCGDGWKEFCRFIVELVMFWKWVGNPLPFIILILPYVCWWYFAEHIMKNYQGKKFIMHDDGITIVKRNGVKQEISYPMLKEAISRKKIRIGPDWVEIPYENKKFRVYSKDKWDVVYLFQQLKEKCDFPFPREELEETLKEYMIGWSVSYLFGIPCMLFGCHVAVVAFLAEEAWSLNGLVSMLFSNKNVIGMIGVIIILIGYMIKFIYFDLMKKYFKPYKQFIRVSL